MEHDSSSQGRVVMCPECGKPANYTKENASRPFCSERCRLIDLGAWADETYRIPAPSSSSDSLSSATEQGSEDDEDY